MKLTRRQQEFIANLIDLSDEFEGPIHYSKLAERLGVSPFTAYDMLRVLEEKGLVTSEYHLPADKNGPGRAERLFYPTRLSTERDIRLSEKFGGRVPDKEELKRIVFSGIDVGKFDFGDIWNKELADELLARVPDIEQGEISYCIEIMTIIVLRMEQSSSRKLLLDHLPALLPESKGTHENLALLGGFAFGILAQEGVEDVEWIQQLFVYIQQYLSIVLQLKSQECEQLAEALTEVFAKLMEE